MTVDRTLAITERIVRQMLRDRRSVGLLIVGPLIVMSLVGFSLFEQRAILDRVAPGLLAVFVLFFTFILTGVGFLRERAQGTLERLQTTLVGSFDIMLGYMLGFLIFAVVQTAVILAFTIFALRIEYSGTLWEIGAILFLVVTVAVSLGIFISSFASNEFQVVQFIPIVLAPQIFLIRRHNPRRADAQALRVVVSRATPHVRRRRAARDHVARNRPNCALA